MLLFISFKSIIKMNSGSPPLTYRRFKHLITRMQNVEPPAETITLEAIKGCSTPTTVDHDAKFGVPTLEELGKLL